MWWDKIAHYTLGFRMGCFFGLGCFPLLVCVWAEGLFRTVNIDAMLESVGVSVGYVAF